MSTASDPTPPVAPVTHSGPIPGTWRLSSMRSRASAAVKPAVPRIMDSRRSSPAGSGIVQRDSRRANFEYPPSRVSLRPQPVTSTGSPSRNALSVDATTWPATSMPPTSGNRRRILPLPVPARASLKLTEDQAASMTTSPGERSSSETCSMPLRWPASSWMRNASKAAGMAVIPVTSAQVPAALLVEPFVRVRRHVAAHPLEQRVDVVAVPQVLALLRMQEALGDHAVHHRQQRVVEIVDVEEGAGLVAQAELAPGQHLEHLVQGAEAAGQGDEGIGQVEHARLAFVHVGHDLEPGDAAMRDFPVHELLGDDADHFAAGGQRGVGDDAHQADVAAAVDQGQAFLRQAGAQLRRALGVRRPRAGVGAAVDADRTQRGQLSWPC